MEIFEQLESDCYSMHPYNLGSVLCCIHPALLVYSRWFCN